MKLINNLVKAKNKSIKIFVFIFTYVYTFSMIKALTYIKLEKSITKHHFQMLNSLKFLQKNKYFPSSFLEEKDISLHQQVLAQKNLATYYGKVEVGKGRGSDPNKKQTFKMLFDTGSCEFWIPSEECKSSRCLNHTRYSYSHTYKPYKHAKMSIEYLSGTVEGEMCHENVFLGDLEVPKQVVGIAKKVDIELLDDVIWDGIIGLAYPNEDLLEKKINPLMDNIIKHNILHKRNEKNQFSYYIGSEQGAIIFGGANMKFKKNFDEEFKWAPIKEKNYWTITLKGIHKYNKNNTNYIQDSLSKKKHKALIDTGTFLIYGPENEVNELISDLNLNECQDKNNLPNIGFIFKGLNKKNFELILTPDDYVLEFDINGKKECVIGIGTESEDEDWTFGQVFLRSYYSVFDRETESVGNFKIFNF